MRGWLSSGCFLKKENFRENNFDYFTLHPQKNFFYSEARLKLIIRTVWKGKYKIQVERNMELEGRNAGFSS